MTLSGKMIQQLIDEGIWTYYSLDGAVPNIGPNSMDVRLSPHILVMSPSDKPIIPGAIQNLSDIYTEQTLDMDGIVLYPGEFILGSAMERIDCSKPWSRHINAGVAKVSDPHFYAQHYDGRSTMARIGIQSHVSAGFGDAGFKGAFTMEICNQGTRPVQLVPGMRIGQVYFERIDGPISMYDGYDQSDFKPQLPRLGPGRF